ncbi:MAG: hypothetical protein ACREIA_05385, partial [Opitutaceae bacterium]
RRHLAPGHSCPQMGGGQTLGASNNAQRDLRARCIRETDTHLALDLLGRRGGGRGHRRAGLQRHDVLTRLDDQILIDGRQLSVLVRGHKEGDTITLTRLRAGSEAKAEATLVGKELPVARVFEFHGRGHGPDVFHHALPYPASEYNRVFQFSAVPTPPALSTAPDRVMLFRPKTNIVYTGDDGVTLELIADEDGQTLKARDSNGKIIFDGPVTTKEDREALSEDLRARLEKLESMQVEEPPVPPPPPAFPGAPLSAPETI